MALENVLSLVLLIDIRPGNPNADQGGVYQASSPQIRAMVCMKNLTLDGFASNKDRRYKFPSTAMRRTTEKRLVI